MSGMSVVAHNLQAMAANRYLGITGGNQAKSTEKLSSGYKINRAADDAAGLAISEKMRKQIRGLTRGTTNAEDGVSMCQIADGALNEVHDMIHRITELSVQSANGTNSAADRQAIQAEVDQIIGEIDRVSETSKFNEIYLFKPNLGIGQSGSNTITNEEIVNQFLTGTYPTITNPVDGITKEHAKGLMSVLSSMLIADEFAKMDLEIKAEPDDEMRRAGELLMLSHDNMCRLCSVMVDPNAIVTQPNGVYDPDEKTDDYINQKIVFNKLYSDVFATDSETLKLTATLMTTSVEFKWADHRDAKGNRIQNLERAIFEAGDYSPYYNMNEAPLDWLKGQGALVCDILKNNGRISDGKYTGTGDYGASEFARLAVNYMSKAEPSLTSGRLRDLYRELIGGGSQTSRERTAVAIYKYMYGLEEGGDGFNRTRIQSGADCGDEIFIDIRPMDASILGIAGLDVSTENGATGAIDTAGEALKKLSAMRSLIGAQQNRLEHTIANQKNIIENTQHSESVIRDTDMAEEMVRFSKENILQQAGQSMLAQANRSTEGVLALLR